MGCTGSKQAVEAADVYHPPPASIAYFNIDTIKEPWLITAGTKGGLLEKGKPTHLPHVVLDTVDGKDGTAPKPWSEVSKALEDLKPTLLSPVSPLPAVNGTTGLAKSSTNIKDRTPALKPPPSRSSSLPATLPEGLRPVSRNSFILRDREEREKRKSTSNEDPTKIWRRDPLHGLPELCPPGGAETIVLYTTTVRAVRRTFDDCEAMRQTLEGHLLGEMDIDERDISLHGEYLKELKELLGEEASVPRLFVMGRYIGGVQDAEQLNETGRLGAMIRLARRKLGCAATEAMRSPTRRKGCNGCGGVRFVPCLVCNGSCKVVAGDHKGVERCGECNENGLMKCPRCN